jgi:predicted RNA methylase
VRNGYDDVIHVINGNGMEVDLPEKVDVAVSELLSCGLFYEPQIQVMNNAKRFLKQGGQFIPESVESKVELITAETHSYGLRLDYVDRSAQLPNDDALTNAVSYSHLHFAEDLSGWIDGDVTLTALSNGVANALRITGRAKLADDIYTGHTSSLFNPLVVFLPEAVEVTRGRQYDVRLHYLCGGDTLDAEIGINEVTSGASKAA